ncbi:MAG: efflux RND transporter periplasmic adaptor subunit [Reichenbachiella sp.]|uniref:efflux RND transporter periplasmic adaptor subunit n=1 Tax=Reichenbachiella sp. TaxID=2184521 RepID=UPI003262E977
MHRKIQTTLYLLMGLIMIACGGKEQKKKEIIRPVMFQKVVPGGGVQSRTFAGTAKSGTETKLSFKVPGNIQSLPVKVGQEVKRNTLIATLDNSDFQLEYEQADASVKNADAQEKQAKSAYERVRSLYENGNTSLSEFESAKAAYESAKANESSAKKSRKLARAQLGYTKLYAPVRGKIATIDAEVNENVSSGQQIVMLSSEGDLEVNMGIPESFISNVNVQDVVEVVFSSIEDQAFKGVVSEVSFSINTQTSTYPVVIKIEGDTKSVRPGMAASATFQMSNANGASSDLLIVPGQAVGEDEEGKFVFALEAKDEYYLAKRRTVSIGQLTTSGFEILEGLEEGELVATAGLQTLLDGDKVRLFEN